MVFFFPSFEILLHPHFSASAHVGANAPLFHSLVYGGQEEEKRFPDSSPPFSSYAFVSPPRFLDQIAEKYRFLGPEIPSPNPHRVVFS